MCLIILEGKLESSTSSVDAVTTVMQTPGLHSSVLLAEISRVLKPGGDFIVQEPLDADAQELMVVFRATIVTVDFGFDILCVSH